jgi:hypothetical protein
MTTLLKPFEVSERDHMEYGEPSVTFQKHLYPTRQQTIKHHRIKQGKKKQKIEKTNQWMSNCLI